MERSIIIQNTESIQRGLMMMDLSIERSLQSWKNMMSETEVCLKWNTFHESIFSSFELLWEEEDLVDVTLAAGDQLLHAHKMILSACSPFFRKIFQETHCKHPVLILPGINVNDLKKLLNFIYKGEVYIVEENLSAFLQLAENLQIKGLWKPPSSRIENEEYVNNIDQGDSTIENETVDNNENKDNFDSLYKTGPPAKRPRRNSTKRLSSSQSLLIPACKTEVKELDKDIYGDIAAHALADEQFGKCLLEWQKGIKQASINETNRIFGQHPITDKEGHENKFSYMNLPYADLLPPPETLQMWAHNRTLDQFACDLMKMLFSTEERIVCNVNGKMGKLQFNVKKINLIREVIQFFSNLNEGAFEEQWKICVTKIDTANRGLKRRFKSKDVVFCEKNF